MHILAGQFKGRKLLSPPGRSLARPITSLAKKSLFGMLADRVTSAIVLDLYCATGTLGLEALSRGARKVRFAERDRGAIERLRRNIETLSAGDCCEIWGGDVTAALPARLESLGAKVDIAFVDPPYDCARQWKDPERWRRIERRVFVPLAKRLADDGLIILRAPADALEIPTAPGLVIERERRYGGMVILMFARRAAGE